MDLFVFTCVFLGAIAIALGSIVIYMNLTTAPAVVPVAVSKEDEYILTKMGTIIVPKNCKPTRRLQLAMLRASHISTPFGCTDDSKVVFVQDAHYRYQAYYVGTK